MLNMIVLANADGQRNQGNRRECAILRQHPRSIP
jgi:hypothetical protein